MPRNSTTRSISWLPGQGDSTAFTRPVPQRARRCAAWLLVALAACAAPAAAQADGGPTRAEKKELETSGGPYCGVYSVYAALRLFDIPVRFDELLEPKYVGSFFGSTMAELRQAVQDFGASAEPMQGLTASALRVSPHPIILHVRRPGLRTTYAHWVLFLGVEDSKARIVDPPHSVQLLPFPELLALWDGTGLAVAERPPRTWFIRIGGWFEQATLFLLAFALLAGVRLCFAPCLKGARWRRGTVFGLAALSFGLAAVIHLVHDDGFLRNHVAVAQVVSRHFKPALPSLSVVEVAAMLDRPGVTLIDARHPETYRAGHMPGAINLPVYSGLVERAETLQTVDPGNRVIVYCQSAECGWGEAIAADLAFRGYRNVVLFPGGWNEWARYERSKPRD